MNPSETLMQAEHQAAETPQGIGPATRIRPSRNLQQRCLLPGDGSQAAVQAISRAEQALDNLAVNFDSWMQTEIANMAAARRTIKTFGMTASSVDALFAVAHDLKGQASTLGYPFAGDICASLCRLIDACAGRAPLPELLVDQHVDAVVAIVREGARGISHPKASVLVRKLYDVTEDYLAQISKRPAHAA